ncbi:MAG TPA: DinB family protein [Bryobacteraceae bacterium]|jgi:uncharacterized damage-inducible protein DinB
MSISQALLPEFDQEVATTRKVLDRLPDDKYGWKPHEKSMAAGRLASHIAEMGGWGSMTMTTEFYDFAPGGVNAIPPANYATKAELLENYDKAMGETRAALAAASDGDFMSMWSLQNNGKVMMTMPRVAVIRGFVMNHIVHHRGQLSVYLRLLDIPVPSIYGPSADERPF